MMLFKILRAVNFLELSARILCFFIVWIVNSLLLLNVLNGTQTDRQTDTHASKRTQQRGQRVSKSAIVAPFF